MMNSIY